jgi:hypothetical protein
LINVGRLWFPKSFAETLYRTLPELSQDIRRKSTGKLIKNAPHSNVPLVRYNGISWCAEAGGFRSKDYCQSKNPTILRQPPETQSNAEEFIPVAKNPSFISART